jgi:hypothetical protein
MDRKQVEEIAIKDSRGIQVGKGQFSLEATPEVARVRRAMWTCSRKWKATAGLQKQHWATIPGGHETTSKCNFHESAFRACF